jgi:hypothetical protein
MTRPDPDHRLHAILLSADAGAADRVRRLLGEATLHIEHHLLRALATACRLEASSREEASWGLPPRGRVAIVMPDLAAGSAVAALDEARRGDLASLEAAVLRRLPRIEIWRLRGESLERIEAAGQHRASPRPPAAPRDPPSALPGRIVTPEEIRMLLQDDDAAAPPSPAEPSS